MKKIITIFLSALISLSILTETFPLFLAASVTPDALTGITDRLPGSWTAEDFSAVAEGELPAGWDKSYSYPGINTNGESASGLTGDTVSVGGGEDGAYLQNNSSGGDHIITLPALGTEEYEAEIGLEYSDYEVPETGGTEESVNIRMSFDEADREYISDGDESQSSGSATYTTVDGEIFSQNGAAVREYLPGNKAMKITALATRMNTFPAMFSIVDQNSGYGNFKPKTSVKYKISFRYTVNSARPNDSINVELRWEKNYSRNMNYYENSSYIADNLLQIPAATTYEDWQYFEKEITLSSAPSDATAVFIALSDGKSWSGGEWYRGSIEMWIDDFEITAVSSYSVTNTYDEELEYITEGSAGNLYTNLEGVTISKWGASVQPTEEADNKAVNVTALATRGYEWPASIRILDSHNGYTNFVPAANEKYKISFRYKIDAANSRKPIAIELRWDKADGNMSMSYENLTTWGFLIDTLVSSPAGTVTDGWQYFEKEVTLAAKSASANNLYIAVTTGLNDWVGKESDIDLWIDDITVSPVSEEPAGGFGIVTDISNDYRSDTGVTLFRLEPANGEEGAKIAAEQRASDASLISDEPVYISGEGIEKYFGAGGPAPDSAITFKAVHADGKSEFYLNGKYVCGISDTNDGADINDRIGIYNNGGKLKIRYVKIRRYDQIFEGDTVEDRQFYDTAPGEIPDGWDKSTVYRPTLFWNSDKSSGNSDTKVSEEGYLQHKASGGTHILTLPEIGTENYMISAAVRYNAGSASFGIVTDLPENYAEARSATVSAIDPRSDSFYVSVFNRTDNGVSGVTSEDITLTGEDAAEFFGSQMPEPDSDINITVYHYRDYTYFYVNGIYAGGMADTNGANASRAGFYSCGGDIKIYSVKIKEIAEASEITEYAQKYGTVLDYDFKSEENLEVPEGWKTFNGGWTWLGENVEVSAYDSGTDKGILLDSTVKGGGTGALILPKLGTADYCMTAEIKLLTEDYGTFGLLNNITDPAENSQSAVHMTADAAHNHIDIYDRNGGSYRNSRVASVDTAFGDKSDGYDTYTLEAYSYGGRSYFFIDGAYISSINQVVPEQKASLCGFYTYNCKILISSVTVCKIAGEPNIDNAMEITGVSLRYADTAGNSEDFTAAGLRFNASVNKESAVYSLYCDGTYEYTENGNIEFGIVFAVTEKLKNKPLTVDSEYSAAVTAADNFTQNEKELFISAELIGMPAEMLDKNISVRGFALIRENGKEKYYYTDTSEYSAAQTANKLYELTDSEDIRNRLDRVFAESENYLGKDMNTFTFTVFSDFHYKENMYLSSVEDMQEIMSRAENSGSELVIHAGDFSNDFGGSPEIINAYLNNEYGLPAYGIYGNHELESAGNTMQSVTPALTNRADEVIWGTSDGKIGDGSVGYYYFDSGNYRFVCTDTNYSLNPQNGQWEHNTENSYGPPSGNIKINSLGPVQLEWLESVLTNAAYSGKKCIVVSHTSFSDVWGGASSDAEAVRAIFSRANDIKKGTVILSINGHNHTNRIKFADNILYLDINTVRNGHWVNGAPTHYDDELHTFMFSQYDAAGNLISSAEKPLNYLWQSGNTWYFSDPLSANITISESGKITVDGVQSEWIYDVVPTDIPDYITPEISDNTVQLWY